MKRVHWSRRVYICTVCGERLNARTRVYWKREGMCHGCREKAMEQAMYKKHERVLKDLERAKSLLPIRYAVLKALKTGILVRQPCEVCGALRTHGHHPDYTRPLLIQWLCPAHHLEAHRQPGRGLRRK
jgi:hypothetical protein